MTLLVLLSVLSGSPAVAAGPPRRPIPDPVLDELDALEDRFERALALDCAEGRCFATGCVYVDHAVADRPRSGSLPGLGDNQGPGAVPAQPWLTKAQCGFAHEPALEADDVKVLVRRLQARVSTGWVSVGVSPRAMDPLPEYFRTDPAVEPPAVDEAPPEPELVEPTAGEELWTALLPHFAWMLGLALLTTCVTVLVWAFRRVGRASIEEQMLLAELAGEAGAPEAPATAEAVEEDPGPAYVAHQQAVWAERLDAVDPQAPDPALQALVRDRLREGDIAFLAKALLRFPERFAQVFPAGGDVATAKLALADFLRGVDPATLPTDAAFFQALSRHAVAAQVASQPDADLVRRLRDDFGPAGIAGTISELSPRLGGLLYAWTRPATQLEVAGLVSPRQAAAMGAALLRSNRMDPRETEALFSVFEGDGPPPSWAGRVTDRGPELDVAGALSVLLERLARPTRSQVLAEALAGGSGQVPGWLREVFVADMLDALPEERRADLLLDVDVDALAAWLAVQEVAVADRVRAAMPRALQATVSGLSVPSDPDARAAAARAATRALGRGLHAQLSLLGLPFSAVLSADAPRVE